MGWKLWRCYQNGGLDQEGREQAFVSARYELHRASPIGTACTCTIDRSIKWHGVLAADGYSRRVAVAVKSSALLSFRKQR
jgi:hypothetical protein